MLENVPVGIVNVWRSQMSPVFQVVFGKMPGVPAVPNAPLALVHEESL